MENQSISIRVDNETAPIFVETGYIAIRESVDFFVPMVTLKFTDRMSSFVSYYPFMQDTAVDINLDDGNVLDIMSFLAFSSSKDLSLGGIEDYRFTLDLISKYADPLLVKNEFHSIRGLASDYVRYIADACGLESDVETTKNVRSWINPNWTHAQMVRYLAQRAVAVSGSAGYLYFVNRDGVLVFKSIDKLFDEAETVDITACAYTMESEDGDYTLYNKQLLIKDNHFASVILGTNNLKLNTYNYKQGAYSTENVNYNGYLRKRGVIKGVAVDLANEGRQIYTGTWHSESNTFPASNMRYAYNKVLRQYEVTQIQIMSPLNNNLELGGVVNLSIAANPDIIVGGVNLNYSGKYLIKSILTVGHGDYMQKLILVRPGMSLPKDRKTKYY